MDDSLNYKTEMIEENIRIIGVIPARYHSTRFPGKPLVPICGKPMIQHVYERSRKAHLISEVWVATDDHRICEAVESFDGKVILTSPDHCSGTERIAEAAQKISGQIFINIQGDEPLIQPEAIDLLAQTIRKSPAPVATLKRKISQKEDIDNPNCVKVVTDKEGFALYFSRSAIPFHRDAYNSKASHYQHIGIYAYWRDFLLKIPYLPFSILEQTEKLEQLRILENGYKIKVIQTDYESYGVDTPEDLRRVESFLTRV